MADEDPGELRRAYRTLNEPTKLLGVSVSGWAGLVIAGGIAYAFLAVSPLPWRLNFSAVVIGLGGPVLLLMLQEPGTIGPGRLVAAVLAWRSRPAIITSEDARPLRRGAIRLTTTTASGEPPAAAQPGDLPWTTADAAPDAGDAGDAGEVAS